VGAALSSTTGLAILVSAFPPRQRGRVLGYSVSAVYLGLALGPFAGGIITQYLGWRYIFYASVIMGLITITISSLFLGKDPDVSASERKIDLKGTLFYMAGLVALVFGSSRIPSLAGWSLMAGGIVSLLTFWFLEKRSAHPIFDTRLFTQNRLFAFSNLAALINYSATFAIVFLMSLFLQKITGLSPIDAGTVMVAQPAVMALFSPVAGRLSDRIEPRYLATLGMSICTTGLAAFAFLGAGTPVWVIIAGLAWVGFGFALFSSPNMNTIMSAVDRTRYGLASGVSATMRVVGQIVSMTVATLFFAAFLGKQAVETVPDHLFILAVRWAFLTFALISIVGIYFSYQRGKLNREG
jgi:MFS family permease